MNWPAFENAAKKMSTSQFFHGSARGPGPKPIPDEKCKVDILKWPLFDFEKKNPDSLPTYWDFEPHRLHKHFPENQKYSRAAL